MAAQRHVSAEPSSWAHPCSESPYPKTFLVLAAPRLPPHPAAAALGSSAQEKASGNRKALAANRHPQAANRSPQAANQSPQAANNHLRLQTTSSGPTATLFHVPRGRGQCALTVGQELHPLAQALEVRVPQGCLRRNPALGFVLQKAPEKGGYIHTARAKWHLVGCAPHAVHTPVRGVHLSSSICCLGAGASKRCAHHWGTQVVTSATGVGTRDTTHGVTMGVHCPHHTCLVCVPKDSGRREVVWDSIHQAAAVRAGLVLHSQPLSYLYPKSAQGQLEHFAPPKPLASHPGCSNTYQKEVHQQVNAF